MVGILIRQIVAMVVMMAVGVALIKTQTINEKGVKQLSSIAMYVATPAVIIQAFAIPFDAEQLVNGAWVSVFVIASLLAATLLGRLVLARSDRVGRFAIIFNNAGFVGIPIIQVVLGPEYVFYVTIIIAVASLYMWTYGVVLISGDSSMVSLKKITTNPAIIALFVGLALFLLPVDLPEFVDLALSGLANLNTGLAMIVLGANLGMANIGLMFADLRLYRASALRLIAMPLINIALLLVLPMPYEIKVAMAIAQATPCAAASSMLAQLFGGDYQYGTGLVIMTTILSMASLPLVLTLAINVL